MLQLQNDMFLESSTHNKKRVQSRNGGLWDACLGGWHYFREIFLFRFLHPRLPDEQGLEKMKDTQLIQSFLNS